jgi:hypothetical protein
MRWLIKPFIRPIARRILPELYQQKDRLEAAIYRARKSKQRVSDLYDLAKRTNEKCHRWERWL